MDMEDERITLEDVRSRLEGMVRMLNPAGDEMGDLGELLTFEFVHVIDQLHRFIPGLRPPRHTQDYVGMIAR